MTSPTPIEWATLQQLAASLGRPLSADETSRATELLDRARVRILTRVPHLADLVQSGAVLPDAPAIVQADMVGRVLNDPMGIRSEGVTEGAYYTRDSGAVGGYLRLTAADLELLGQTTEFGVIAPSYRIEPPPGGLRDLASW